MFSVFGGDLDVARQALADGVWNSALAAADNAATSTNIADRTAARLISLEALAYLEKDAEIRQRLASWNDGTSERFRYWHARSLIRVGDFDRAAEVLKEPFTEVELVKSVTILKASLLVALGKFADAAQMLSALDMSKEKGLEAEDYRLLMAEALCRTNKRAEANTLLDNLVKEASRTEIKTRAGLLLGFSEMEEPSTYTTGVARVRLLLRTNPGDKISEVAAKSFAEKLLQAGNAAEAEDEYRRYLEAFPSAAMDPSVLERRGQALFMLGRYSESAAEFVKAERVLKDVEDKTRLAYLQGNSYLADGKHIDAAASFQRSFSYGGKESNRSLYAQADALERAKDYEQSHKIYEKLVSIGDIWGQKANLRLISATSRNGRLGDAIEKYTKVISSPGDLSDEDITEAYLGRGRSCYKDYRFKEASADFEVVATRNPKLADGMRFLMALCLYGSGRDAEAKDAAEALMRSTEDEILRADLMLWCAKYEFNHSDYKEAQSHFVEYASLRKGSASTAEALLWAARCASAQMEYAKAVELATQAANAAASNKQLFIEALLVQGEAVMELGRYAEAVQLFDRVMNLAGDGAFALNAAMLKADALYAMGAGDLKRYEEAVEAYRILYVAGGLSQDRKIEVAFKIGRALEKLRHTKEAMDQYYRNVVLVYTEEISKGALFGTPARTFFSRAAFSLADYYLAAGDKFTTIKMLERIVKSDVPAAKEAQRRLAELNGKGNIK
jgi:tetratricopeptide (TPR) repeat protein